MINNNLKVSDKELEIYADKVYEWDNLDECFGKYIAVLESLKDTAIKSGNVHDTIDILYQRASLIQKNMANLGTTAASNVEKFLKQIDEIDLEIYREG